MMSTWGLKHSYFVVVVGQRSGLLLMCRESSITRVFVPLLFLVKTTLAKPAFL